MLRDLGEGDADLSDYEVFMRAYAIVEAGWCQGHLHQYPYFGDQPIRSCAVGAMERAKSLDSLEYYRKLFAVRTEIDLLSIPHWNDAPGRTKEEVMHAFLTAAQRSY